MVPRVTGNVWTTYSDSDHAGEMAMGTSRSHTGKDACLRLWVAEDMHVPVEWPMTLHVDNAAGVSLQHSTCGHTTMKGIFKMSEDWVQELKDVKKVVSVHVPTDRNLADMLTKGLSVDVRSKLDAILAQIAETVVSGGKLDEVILGSKSKLQIDKQVKTKLAAAAR